MKALSFARAHRLHEQQWFEGRHRKLSRALYTGFPYREHDDFAPERYADGFVQVTLPLKRIEAYAVDESLIPKYAKLLQRRGPDAMGPAWGKFMFRYARAGNGCWVTLVDGNHRALAARELDWDTIEVILPTFDYRALQKCHTDLPANRR